jgi:hypothetical protein
METLGAWTPTTPEMEAKVMFGRHIWDFAQHADALGKRMFELRQPIQHSVAPSVAYTALLDELLGVDDTPGRLAALYDVLLPGVQRRYEAYAATVDAVVDAPSLVIIERILLDARRQRDDVAALRRELGLAEPPAHPLATLEGALEVLGTPAP